MYKQENPVWNLDVNLGCETNRKTQEIKENYDSTAHLYCLAPKPCHRCIRKLQTERKNNVAKHACTGKFNIHQDKPGI